VSPKQGDGVGEGHCGCSWHHSHVPSCHGTTTDTASPWVVHQALEGLPSSGVQYQSNGAGQAWHGAITRKLVCMLKKGKPNPQAPDPSNADFLSSPEKSQ